MAKKVKRCFVDGCDRGVYALDLCNRCYQRAWYWDQKSLKEKVARLRDLRLWANGMSQQLGSVTGIDVPPAKTKRGGRR